MTDEEDAKGLYGAWLGWLAEVDRIRAAAVAARNTEIAAAVRGLRIPETQSDDPEHDNAVWQYNAGLAAVLAFVEKGLDTTA